MNELTSNKHYEMSFVEFIEAFGRVAEKATLLPDATESEADPAGFGSESYSPSPSPRKRRFGQPPSFDGEETKRESGRA